MRSTFHSTHTSVLAARESRLWVCIKCGETWARMVVDQHKYWKVVSSLCDRCDIEPNHRTVVQLHLVSGSMWPDIFDDDLIASFPASILSREAKLHFQYWEKHCATKFLEPA
jgi:hypothetical protein